MGKIILLNTPIGNLSDLTPRVLEALREGEVFAVEDTRVFRDLLNHLGISIQGKRILSLHDQSGDGQVEKLLELASQTTLYVASEAGSPIVSDPAYPLVTGAYDKGLQVESYSGVSAPIMALELSGLPPIPFHFHGFLPRESGKRISVFRELPYGTHIFFEAPNRVEETLNELSATLPECQIAVLRELSKKFEQVLRFKGKDWESRKAELTIKGEFVLLVHQSASATGPSTKLKALAQEALEDGATPKLLSKLLSEILNQPSKDIYHLLNQQKKK